jgi:flagellar motility protein MotE (MotC chaperone)
VSGIGWAQVLPAIVTLITGFLVFLGVWVTTKGSRSNAALANRTAESQAVTAERQNLVDQIQEQLGSANVEASRLRAEMQGIWDKMAQLRREADDEIARLRDVIEDQEKFISILIKHITDGRPPPSPTRPKGGNVL